MLLVARFVLNRSRALAHPPLLGAIGTVLLVTSFVGVGASTAAASTSAFCKAQDKVNLDTSDAKSVRKQVASLLKSKPPADVARALKTIKSRRNGDSVAKAVTVVATFVASKCGVRPDRRRPAHRAFAAP
jgi:hypothetical protein